LCPKSFQYLKNNGCPPETDLFKLEGGHSERRENSAEKSWGLFEMHTERGDFEVKRREGAGEAQNGNTGV
jgi:hypothetical protein